MFDPTFSDAPIAASQAVLEFADVSRNSCQSQFFASMIRATFETRPIRHRAVECEIREVDRYKLRTGISSDASRRQGCGISGSTIFGHTFASLLIQNGESLAYVKEQLGHSSIKMTMDVYWHLVPGANRQAVNRLPTLRLAGILQAVGQSE